MLLIFYLFLRKYIYITQQKKLSTKKALWPIRRVYVRVKDLTLTTKSMTPHQNLWGSGISQKKIYNPNLKRNHWNSKLRFHCPMSPPIKPSQDLLPNHEERSPAERTLNHSDCLIPQNSSYTFLFHHFSHVSWSYHLLAALNSRSSLRNAASTRPFKKTSSLSLASTNSVGTSNPFISRGVWPQNHCSWRLDVEERKNTMYMNTSAAGVLVTQGGIEDG